MSQQSSTGAPTPFSLADFETLAKRHMSHMAFEYVAAGAGDEISLRENERAFDRLRLQPRVLTDVSAIDLRVTLFDQPLDHPILLAPAAYQRLVHPEGEVAAVRGAAAARAILVASCFASTTIEELAREAGSHHLWFQLYVNPDRGFTRELVHRAESAGCRALVITVDSPTLGVRRRERHAGFALPEGVQRANLTMLGDRITRSSHRSTEGSIYNPALDPALTWKDLDWLRGLSRMPIWLKGIVDPADGIRAAEAGAGIIVSNHGGRNLDTLPATIDALPRIAHAVAGRVPILIDGGVRRGTDVIKSVAAGAAAVMIGRPYLYGLAVGGAAGVAQVVELLRRELEVSMALVGRQRVSEIDHSVLWQ